MSNKTGRISVVALPIGNDLDISERAKSVLSEADLIAAEDTRVMHNLSQSLRIKVKQIVSYHNHNETESLKGLEKLLKEGKHIALVSDAGTPGVSDPGFALMKYCFENNIPLSCLPGPSALTASLSLSPLGGNDHYFGAFLPNKSSERIKKLEQLKKLSGICSKAVFFESPHRIIESLKDIESALGNPNLFIAREISKTYESFYFDRTINLINHFKAKAPKGEFVLIIDLQELSEQNEMSHAQLELEIKNQLAAGRSNKEIQKNLQDLSPMNKKELYSFIQTLKDSLGD